MRQITLSDDIKSISYNASALETVKYNGAIVWGGNSDHTDCIVFSSTEDATVRVTKGDSAVEYSMDGEAWSDVDGVMMCSLNPSKLYLRNKSENVPTISIDGTAVYISGNITTMIDYTKSYNEVDIPDDCFTEWLANYDVREIPTIRCRHVGARAFAKFASMSGISVAPVIDVQSTQTYSFNSAFFQCENLTMPVSAKFGTVNGNASLYGLFQYSPITEATITFGNADNSDFTMQAMFYKCTQLTKARFNGNYVKDMYQCYRMFYRCYALRDIYYTSNYVNFDTELPEATSDTGRIHVKADAEVGTFPTGWEVVRDM